LTPVIVIDLAARTPHRIRDHHDHTGHPAD